MMVHEDGWGDMSCLGGITGPLRDTITNAGGSVSRLYGGRLAMKPLAFMLAFGSGWLLTWANHYWHWHIAFL
jgi:choline-glycine betaine transporter